MDVIKKIRRKAPALEVEYGKRRGFPMSKTVGCRAESRGRTDWQVARKCGMVRKEAKEPMIKTGFSRICVKKGI